MAPSDTDSSRKAGRLHFFCPLCKYHQSTSTIDRMRFRHHAQLAVLTVALTLFAYPIFEWNGLIFYIVFWAGFEFFYRLRKRQALVCQSCGFDPFLYKQDVGRARRALRSHWELRIARENLFANLRLRNYQTARVGQEASSLATAEGEQTEEKKDSARASYQVPTP